MSTPDYLADRDLLVRVGVTGNAFLGRDLLTNLLVGRSFTQVRPLVERILNVNDALTYLAMPTSETPAERQIALDYLLSNLPRPTQPKQVINTLVDYAPCECEEESIPDAPTNGLVDDASNVFSCVPNPLYPSLQDYELEISYVDIPPAPVAGLVDNAGNVFSFLTLVGLASTDEYEYEILP
jgi:hypothetical protein